MATEVKKLITVSLGKIHQSRQKNGLNLRKTLLVTSVLHKARDLYVTEIKNKRVTKEEDNVNTVTVEQHDETQHSEYNITSSEYQTAATTTTTSSDTTTTSNPSTGLSDENMDASTTQNKENNPPPITDLRSESLHKQSNDTGKSAAPCQSCSKRKYREAVEDADPSSSGSAKTLDCPNKSNIVPKKRQRLISTNQHTSTSSCVVDQSEVAVAQQNTTDVAVPMQTDSINNLVQRFSMSFGAFSTEHTAIEHVDSNCIPLEKNTFSLCRPPVALSA